MAKALPKWDTHDVESLREFSNTRLIAVDLDGTLIHSSSDKIFENILSLSSHLNHPRYKVALTLATGRTLFGTLPMLEKLALPKGRPIVLYNGSLVVRNGIFDVIHKKTISALSLRTILEYSCHFHVRIYAYLYNDPTQSLFHSHDDYEYVLGWSETSRPRTEFNRMPIRWQSELDPGEIQPSAILIDTSENPVAAGDLETALIEMADISVTRSGTSYLEIRPQGSNKGTALAVISEFLNISKDEILALGDNDNDAEMLAWAGIGVAISNCSPVALANSDYVCKYDVSRGAVEVLRLIKTARYYFFEPTKKADGR